MDSDKNSDKKAHVFCIAKFRSKTKLSFFDTQSIENNVNGMLSIATTCFPSLSSLWQHLIYPVFTKDVLKLSKRLYR